MKETPQNLMWTPDKDLLTEFVMHEGIEYPEWMFTRAVNLSQRMNTPLTIALEVVKEVVEAERNATLGDPNERIRPGAFFFLHNPKRENE